MSHTYGIYFVPHLSLSDFCFQICYPLWYMGFFIPTADCSLSSTQSGNKALVLDLNSFLFFFFLSDWGCQNHFFLMKSKKWKHNCATLQNPYPQTCEIHEAFLTATVKAEPPTMTSLESLGKNKWHSISNFKTYNMSANYFHKYVSKWKKKIKSLNQSRGKSGSSPPSSLSLSRKNVFRFR